MTSKRKADLQRKLALASVPRPPEGLAERIKADIPRYLNVDAERDRLARSMSFNLRIAASIVIMISSVAALFFVMSSDRASMAPAIAHKRAVSEPSLPAQIELEIAQQDAAPAQTATLQYAYSAADQKNAAPAAPAPRAVATAEVRDDAGVRAGNARRDDAVREEDAVAEGRVGGAIAMDRIAEVAPAPAPEPPPPAPPSLPAAEPATAHAAAANRAASAPSLSGAAYASKLALEQKSVFGISTDADVFRGIKSVIESGGRPAPSSVDIEALVNYFAGARKVKRGVRLEVEASPAPVEAEGDRGILRFTVDTASIDVPAGSSTPPIAKNARIELEFNKNVVERFMAIGDDGPAVPQHALLHNTSVTGLYALDLRAPLRARDTVATIRLHYESVSDGRKHTIERVLRGADFAKPWPRASRRHRLASLGALWGESLRSTHGGSDVARRAEELASQEPNDARARELAEVAVASSGGSR